MKNMHQDAKKVGEIKDKSELSITLIAALQWLVFIMMNTIVSPVIVGNAYGLSAEQIIGLVQRTIFLVGFASLLQILWGHKLPLMEGAAGLWWSIFVIMAQNAVALGENPQLLLPKLEGGLIIAGILLILLGITPVFHFFEKLFTPLITGVYLILFSIQMSIILFSGMLGLTDKGSMDWKFMVVSFVTVTITFLLSFKGKGLVKSFSPLVGIFCGWLLFILLGASGGQVDLPKADSVFSLPRPFSWGMPEFDAGVILMSIMVSFILLSNLFASVQLLKPAESGNGSTATSRRGSIVNGIAVALSGIFSGIGTIPFSISVSFIHLTGNASKYPFIIASVMMIIAGLISPVGYFFAGIPLVVGYAISFVVFSQMITFGMENIFKAGIKEKNLFIFSISACIGISIIFLPAQSFEKVPTLIRGVLSNGMLVGTTIAMIFEHLVFRKSE